MKRLTVLSAIMLALSVVVNLGGISLRDAFATVPSKPYTFVGGTLIQSAQVNANFDPLYSVLNGNIDHSNLVNGTGIYASDIKPVDGAGATFGGTVPYTFPLATSFSNGITIAAGGIAVNTGNVTLSALSASSQLCTDGSKNVTTAGCPTSTTYNGTGTTLTNLHRVMQFFSESVVGCTGTAAQNAPCWSSNYTFTNSAVFTNATSYKCSAILTGSSAMYNGVQVTVVPSGGTLVTLAIIPDNGVTIPSGSYNFWLDCYGS